ncbi:iron-containing alcohol dehydrogenase [Lacicoccus qingdaonensis]|uniref:Alcohol dehydrogenase, class IV n=1 Tax=Lacicoccus qingdaonensis TaxID=576118 RepID=A0A1G9G435_9BACL|nr:iron-containing alcohol dehydrogenase [Salinicoccus qingdaonensis]SDK95053.1 Alcohol dehydrogenase, class IV [Salinicoccus qingdaonensis]
MHFKLFKTYARAYQKTMKHLSKVLNWTPPLLLHGEGILKILPDTLKAKNYNKVLIITDEGIRETGLLDYLLAGLNAQGIKYFIYDGTVANPTDVNIYEAANLYNKNRCDAIIGFGGGSPLDSAKGAAAVIGTGTKNIKKYQGLMKIRKKLPPVIAVPTTAGTGSEGTIATVITDSENLMKYAVSDMVLRPEIAVLDASLTTGLPAEITAHTGMDALSHIIESYTNLSNTAETRNMSETAVGLIYQNIKKAYNNGENITARKNMLYAAYLAGRAFTRGYVGNIHAMAHQIGARYPVTHGEANAIIMPYVLEEYGETVHPDLAKLADCAGITEHGDTNSDKARKFIQSIRDLNEALGIGDRISEIEEADIEEMVGYSFDEANPDYPVPVIFSREKFREMYKKVKYGENKRP